LPSPGRHLECTAVGPLTAAHPTIRNPVRAVWEDKRSLTEPACTLATMHDAELLKFRLA